jgi:hypothetical protein
MEAALALKLWDQVVAGNVTAMKAFQQFVDRNDQVLNPKKNDPKEDHDDDLGRDVARWDDEMIAGPRN